MSETGQPPGRGAEPRLRALAREFFEPRADVIAPRLLGCWLLRRTPAGTLAGGPVVETEAYLADDPACHAYGGCTPRNRSMFGAPGRAYVYLIYGCHYCVNAVCQPAGVGEAVLIRAIEPRLGLDWMRARRPVPRLSSLTNGPAKLCAALGIDRQLDGADLCDAAGGLFLATAEGSSRNPTASAVPRIVCTTRIGITKAAHQPWRFYLEGNEFVSRKAAAR